MSAIQILVRQAADAKDRASYAEKIAHRAEADWRAVPKWRPIRRRRLGALYNLRCVNATRSREESRELCWKRDVAHRLAILEARVPTQPAVFKHSAGGRRIS